MSSLSAQRCFRHSLREAVASCAGCGNFFCRECVVEHDGQMWCADCLRRITHSEVTAQRRSWGSGVLQILQLGFGIFVAWLVFYWIGKLLLQVPDAFHNSTLWGGP